MKKRTILNAILLIASTIQLFGANYSFNAILVAGLPGAADYEIGLGTGASVSTVTQNFGYNTSGVQHWRTGGLTQDFRIGWDATANAAYVRLTRADGTFTTATMSNSGPALGTNAVWTLPANSMLVWAAGATNPSSIQLSGLTLSPNAVVVNGGSLGASQAGNNFDLATVSAPIVINPAANGGNWYLDGKIRFTGLTNSNGSTNAQGFDLGFLMSASGTSSNTPEPSSFGMLGGGLIALVFFRPMQRKGNKK